VIAIGKSLRKLINKEESKQFNQFFSIPRPHKLINSIDDLKVLKDQLVVLQSPIEKKLMLRGQFEYLKEKDEILFIGSPWFASMEQITNNNLAIDDFAIHDPVIDLLHLLKSTEITNDDLKELISTINTQKDNLKKINKEVRDIALFPEQNPDPIIRINFEGDLLQNNSSAAKLNIVEYNDTAYNNEEFLRLIASNIDKNEQRSVIESRSNNIDYSFVCVPIPEEEYINIYGRNITKQKIVQQELENLSLIVQETINAVIITDAKGKIEWVNKAFEKMTGFNLAESVGKTPGSLLQGKGSDQETVAYMKQQIMNEKPFTCEIFNYKKTGEGYWLRINGQPIFDSNQVFRY
jgi:PAS domain S-box-containing protein